LGNPAGEGRLPNTLTDKEMHIAEGILSGPVLAAGAVLTLAGTGIGLKKLDTEKIARAGVLSACFFVASLIHVPIGPSSVHLIFNGAVGMILGWGAFPVILVALMLQAVFFQYGGITTLGVNTFIMAFPAVCCYLLFHGLIKKREIWPLIGAFATGAVSVFFSGLLVGAALFFTKEAFLNVAALVVAAHIPVMIVEGIVTLFLVMFLKRVQPEMLTGENAPRTPHERIGGAEKEVSNP